MNENPEIASVRIHGLRTLPATPLAGIDLNSGFMPVRRVFYYSGQPDVNKLQQSLARALAQWPDFSGTVVLRDGVLGLDRNDTGVLFSVEKHDQPSPPYGIEYPTGLPCSFCDEEIAKVANDGGAVFSIKISCYANNIWVLGTCNSHALCDGSGYWQFMQSWRDAFHGLPLEKIDSNFMRYEPRGAGVEPVTIPGHLKMPMTPLLQQQMTNLGRYQSSQILLPEKSLKHLKNKVNESLAPDWAGAQHVLMALLWKTLATVELKNGGETDQDFPLANVINVRSRLGLKHYTGNMVYSVISHASLTEIVETPLAALAQMLRGDSEKASIADVNHFLMFLQEQLAAGNYNAGGYFTRFSSGIAEDCVNGAGVMVNNWSKFPAYQMDFSGAPVWFDLATVIPMHFIMVMPAADGVVIRLFLPENILVEAIALLNTYSG